MSVGHVVLHTSRSSPLTTSLPDTLPLRVAKARARSSNIHTTQIPPEHAAAYVVQLVLRAVSHIWVSTPRSAFASSLRQARSAKTTQVSVHRTDSCNHDFLVVTEHATHFLVSLHTGIHQTLIHQTRTMAPESRRGEQLTYEVERNAISTCLTLAIRLCTSAGTQQAAYSRISNI